MNAPHRSETPDEAPAGEDAASELSDDERLEQLYDSMLQGIQEGATFKDMYGVSDETMEALYAQAYRFYTSGKLADAEKLFRFLCIYDFHNVEYALGLGAVLQLQKRYEKALDVYGMAYVISEGNEAALFYAGQCHFLLRRRGNARRCFKLLLETCQNADFARKAHGYLLAIEQHAKSQGAAAHSHEDEDTDVPEPSHRSAFHTGAGTCR